jgi:hypothetical protein
MYGFQTILPEIVVEPGCSGAVVSGVIADLRFPASIIPTKNNLFRRVTNGTGRVEGATLIDNLFLDSAYWAWRIDTSKSGFLQNNRFIRQVYHAKGDACVWTASSSAPSPTSGNVMLWPISDSASAQIRSDQPGRSDDHQLRLRGSRVERLGGH